jgi:hypothetical protein
MCHNVAPNAIATKQKDLKLMLKNDHLNIQIYNDLKNLFSQFAMQCEETLLEENNLIISYEHEQDIMINLSVLGQPLEISFSIATTDRDEILGKLSFNRINDAEKHDNVWTLYFDRAGNTRYSLHGTNSIYSINDKESIQMIFVHLLTLYVRKNQFSYLGDNEASLTGKMS